MSKRLLTSKPTRGAVAGLLTLSSCLLHAAGVAESAAIAQANNAFAADLYGQLKSANGNLFFSPYSISLAFGTTWCGAGGPTAEQMGRVLHFTGSPGEVAGRQGGLQTLLNSIQAKGKVQLAIANSIWPEQSHAFREDYLGLLDEHFRVSASPCDFRQQPEGERSRINRWVEEHTNGKIKDLMPSGSVTPLTRLVLANAVYFKGDWEKQFQPGATKAEPFFLGSGGQVKAALMTQKSSFRHAAHPGLQVLAMPYAGGDLSMVVLLPAANDGLPRLESELSAATLAEWTSNLRSTEVTVLFPKFKVDCSFDLKPPMVALGMNDAFDEERADFSRMTGTKDLFISAAMHKAFVEVNEQGTEAAAATGIAMTTRAALPAPPVVFRTDHPFLYLIRHEASGAILFLGRMTDPTK